MRINQIIRSLAVVVYFGYPLIQAIVDILDGLASGAGLRQTIQRIVRVTGNIGSIGFRSPVAVVVMGIGSPISRGQDVPGIIGVVGGLRMVARHHRLVEVNLSPVPHPIQGIGIAEGGPDQRITCGLASGDHGVIWRETEGAPLAIRHGDESAPDKV